MRMVDRLAMRFRTGSTVQRTETGAIVISRSALGSSVIPLVVSSITVPRSKWGGSGHVPWSVGATIVLSRPRLRP
jgi:hypothetical protein